VQNRTAFDEAVLAILLPDMVPKAGLEPARLSPLPPQDSVSTNSTTWAIFLRLLRGFSLQQLESESHYLNLLQELCSQQLQFAPAQE
jgi:hypothetical protein